jgi:hypothetical protein
MVPLITGGETTTAGVFCVLCFGVFLVLGGFHFLALHFKGNNTVLD